MLTQGRTPVTTRNPAGVLLLDGATGTELRARGVEVPSHVTSIWSARALMEAPDAVVGVHRDYIEAGADVIIANNYAVTPPLLAREGLEDRLEALTVCAAELAQRARDEAGRAVRIAGSLPPLETSYRADLVGEDEAILADYRRIAAVLAPRVDLLLCETLASGREARAATTAALETGLEVWLSLTLQGNRRDQLPSGESIEQAWSAAGSPEVAAVLLNCCGANLVGHGVEVLTRILDRPCGGYAHSADVVLRGEGEAPVAVEELQWQPLDVDRYTAAAEGWLDAGASIVGGCCSTGPAHIARLRALIDERASRSAP
jgi:S-methylmethionine-dependent homocysteine/selenocysteine methylase